jgi:hypothetical protein
MRLSSAKVQSLIGGDLVLDAVARVVLRHFPGTPYRIAPRDLRIGGSGRHLKMAKRMIFLAARRAGADRNAIAIRLNMTLSEIENAASIVEAQVELKAPLRTAWLGICHELDAASLVTQ